jgi:hypothetical protein
VVQDGNGGEDTGSVTVAVGAVNDAPVAVDDTASTNEDTAVTIDVVANDTDADGDTLSVKAGSVSVPAAQGTAVLNVDGNIVFTPAADFTGTATISYVVQDGNGGEDTGSVTVAVNPINDDPVITEDVWFQGVHCDPDAVEGMKTEWKYHGGSDKLNVDVTIPLDGIFGDNSDYRFTDVDISEYINVFDGLGFNVADLDIRVKVRDHEVRFDITGRDVELSSADIAGLPEEVDTLVHVEDAYGVVRSLDLCVGFSDATVYSPVVFDLNNSGKIEVTGPSTAKDRIDDTPGETVYFDIDGDGQLERIEWLSGGGDALLVDNRDGNAAGDMNGARLFGDQSGTYQNGYVQLAELDANDDDVLTGAELEGLALWADDGDAVVQAGELHSVQAHGVVQIRVTWDVEQNDNGEDILRSDAYWGSDGQQTPLTSASDLVFDDLSPSTVELSTGESLRLDYDVSNVGTEDASAVRTTFYWSETSTFDAMTAVELGEDTNGRLDAGEIDTNESVSFDYDELASLGQGYIFGVIDAIEAHEEFDETNNVSDAVALTFADSSTGKADLKVLSMVARESSLEGGQDLRLDMTVTNSGGVDAKKVASTVYWSASDVFDLGTAIALDSDSHGRVKAGEVDDNEGIKIDYSDLAALGEGFVFAVIDDANTVDESNEGNNVSDAVGFTFDNGGANDEADVRIDDISLTRSTLSDGDDFRVVLDVENIGGTDAKDTYSEIFWQATSTFDEATAELIAISNHGTLDAGELDDGEKQRVKYEDVEGFGSGYIFARIVAPDGDSDTGNNLSDEIELTIL